MTPTLSPAEWEANERQHQARQWLRELPQGLLDSFDISRHPCPKSHDRVMKWLKGKTGMMLSGSTGRGKSRTLLQLISRLAHQGDHTTYWSAPRLADRISGLAFESVAELDRLLRNLETCGVLALDDLGAHRPTERVATAFHRVIDGRYAANLPLLVTTNCTPPQLQSQLLDEHGRTIRRLREMTDAIAF